MTTLLISNPSVAGPKVHFGDQLTVNNAPGVFPETSNAVPGQDNNAWNFLEWSQQELIDPNAVTVNASYDPTLGTTASYSWSTPDGETTVSAYDTVQQGWVYDLNGTGTTSDSTEHDIFLSTAGDVAINLGGNEIDYSMNARIISESISRPSTDDNPTFAGAVTGFTLNYNLPGEPDYDADQPTFTAFLQIPLSSTQNDSDLLSYFSETTTPGGQPGQIISDQLRYANALLPISGSPITPENYNVTAYVADLASYLDLQKGLGTGVTDLARWTLTGVYTGVMTAGTGAAAHVQFSDIEVTSGDSPSTASLEINPPDPFPIVVKGSAPIQALVLMSALDSSSNDSGPYAKSLASVIGTGLTSNALTAFQYTSGSTVPGPTSGAGGVAFIRSTPTATVTIPTTDSGVVITDTGPTSITGGAAGSTVVAGNGGLTYTNITPSGSGVTYVVAGDGPNLISTAPATSGNYQINTGSGNDTIAVNGNSQINAGTGHNAISVSGGNSLVYSEGYDTITGSNFLAGDGVDSISVGSGNTTINAVESNIFVFGNTVNTNPLLINGGTGSDTISVGRGGGFVVAGSSGNSILFGGIGGILTQPTQLFGTANGDRLFAIGEGSISATAGAGKETITGAGGSPDNFSVPGSLGDNTFTAGSGNDTLIAGAGKDTLIGGSGTAAMISGTSADTFQFQFGKGGNDTITGFKASDTLQLNGYGITTLPTSSVSGSTLITLSDGTTITLINVVSLDPNQCVLK